MSEKKLRIYELYDVWHEPFWHKTWFIVSLVLVFIFLLSCIVLFFIRYKKKQIKLMTPWQEALQQLSALENGNYYEITQHKKFYENITIILKKYLSRRYGLKLASKTDEEAIAMIKQSEFPASYYSSLQEIFEGALFIKFANRQAVENQIKIDASRAKDLVSSTIPD